MDNQSFTNYKTAYIQPEPKPNTIKIGVNLIETKSHLKIGNLIFHNTHHFNWFHRKMWKLFFGFEIENVEEDTK